MTIESKGELIEVSQINSNLSLDVQLEKKIINSNNKQTISFFYKIFLRIRQLMLK